MRLLDDVREVESNALLKDTENKKFISELFGKTVVAVGLIGAFGVAIVFAPTRCRHERNTKQ